MIRVMHHRQTNACYTKTHKHHQGNQTDRTSDGIGDDEGIRNYVEHHHKNGFDHHFTVSIPRKISFAKIFTYPSIERRYEISVSICKSQWSCVFHPQLIKGVINNGKTILGELIDVGQLSALIFITE